MIHPRAIRRWCITGMASLVLAMPGRAQADPITDSLGMQRLNEALRLIPATLSIDLTKGTLTLQVPTIQPYGVGPEHIVWKDTARTDLRAHYTFGWDSGGMWKRAISSRAPLASFELIVEYNTLARLSPLTPAFAAVAEQLGPPDFCERDTTVLYKDNGINVSTAATWRRGTVLISMFRYMNYITLPPEIAPYARRFGVAYRATRTTERTLLRMPIVRHDSPCLLSDEEYREHEQPLDVEAFRALREQLQQRPERPPVP